MTITLPDETRRELITGIQQYFRAERDEAIGDLQASFLLDFVLQEIGPSVYNQAVRDVQEHLQSTVADLGATLYVPEFGYTVQARTARRR